MMRARRGSVYFVVVVTVSAATVLILTGAALRKATRDSAHLHSDSIGAVRAAESGLEVFDAVASRSNFLANMKGRTSVAKAIPVGPATVSVSVEDAERGGAISGSTRSVRMTAVSSAGEARSVISEEFVASSEYERAALALGAVSYWALDEESGETEVRESVYGYDGEYASGKQASAFTHAHGNGAPSFPTESDIVTIGHEDVHEMDAMSIALWVRRESGDRVQGIIAKESGVYQGSAPHHAMYFDNGALVHMVSLINAGNARGVWIDAGEIIDGEWNFVVMTIGTAGRLRLYLNGRLEAYASNVWLGTVNGSDVNEHPWTIGGRRDDPDKARYLDDNLDGSVARVAIFDYELGSTEIQELIKASTLLDGLEP